MKQQLWAFMPARRVKESGEEVWGSSGFTTPGEGLKEEEESLSSLAEEQKPRFYMTSELVWDWDDELWEELASKLPRGKGPRLGKRVFHHPSPGEGSCPTSSVASETPNGFCGAHVNPAANANARGKEAPSGATEHAPPTTSTSPH